ncbi:unnamed protein product [Camellia sinensis]
MKLRVSATMTNAPIVLTLDCDIFSNDPQTPLRALCYLLDPHMDPRLAFVQFPQYFHGLNKDDIYASELKYPFQSDSHGMDGLWGPVHMGTGGFFCCRAFFGGPFSFAAPENPELSPDHVPNKPIRSKEVLSLAYQMGYRYGSLVEDCYTSYRLHCEGWRSIFCRPKRAAFLGDVPVTLNDVLYQIMRWSMGLLEVGFSKNSPLTLGLWSLNPFHALCFIHYSLWPISGIPITTYAFLPQLALLNSFSIFPKVCLRSLVFHVCFSFPRSLCTRFYRLHVSRRNNPKVVRWGFSSFSFGLVEYLFKSLGLTKFGFKQGIFEFGVESQMFLPITMAAIINLVSFVSGIIQVLSNGLRFEDVFTKLFIAGFGVLNSWPVYEAMVLRSDKGKLPTKITLTSVVLSWLLYLVSSWKLLTHKKKG